MPVLSEKEQYRLEYLQWLYPVGMRTASGSTNSIARSYDYIRIFVLNMVASLIEDGADQLLISTATDMWLDAWEEFLGLPNGSALTNDERRTIISSKLVKADSTIRNVRDVIVSFLPPLETYNLREMRSDPTFTVADTRTYMIEVAEELRNTLNFDILKDILVRVHPAHCTLVMNYIKSLVDNIGVESEVTWTLVHTFFTRADEANPVVTDTVRWDEANPLSGSIRNNFI